MRGGGGVGGRWRRGRCAKCRPTELNWHSTLRRRPVPRVPFRTYPEIAFLLSSPGYYYHTELLKTRRSPQKVHRCFHECLSSRFLTNRLFWSVLNFMKWNDLFALCRWIQSRKRWSSWDSNWPQLETDLAWTGLPLKQVSCLIYINCY